ncbi:MAG TPA: hypothetical protein PK752_15095 [Accumulibacter sp.]|uniref:hypothetical protein n=1 Tax=Accumulibacter sp. TaxID=2053492 RepID=UPI002B818090|nr:hypothetical protein [Accumulibacter sp.]HRD89563.1 hypothetical protein [Accumulibacter sp.]
MKILLPIALAALVAATAAVAHEDHDKPRFGGVVAEAGHYQAELVGRSDTLTIHVSEHGTPLPTAGGSARLTLLAGGKKTEVTLLPAGNNRFEAKGSFDIKGAKVVAALNVPGKPPKTLRFALDDSPARH